MSICNGDTITLTAIPNIPGGSFLWANGGITNSTITVNPSISTNYNVMYNLNGCATTAYGAVSVNPVPVVNLSNVTICEGDTANLNAIPDITGGTFYGIQVEMALNF